MNSDIKKPETKELFEWVSVDTKHLGQKMIAKTSYGACASGKITQGSQSYWCDSGGTITIDITHVLEPRTVEVSALIKDAVHETAAAIYNWFEKETVIKDKSGNVLADAVIEIKPDSKKPITDYVYTALAEKGIVFSSKNMATEKLPIPQLALMDYGKWKQVEDTDKSDAGGIKFKFKVNVWESEAGWGRKIDEVREFDSYEEAEKFLEHINSQNTAAKAPEIYWQAERANYTKIK